MGKKSWPNLFFWIDLIYYHCQLNGINMQGKHCLCTLVSLSNLETIVLSLSIILPRHMYSTLSHPVCVKETVDRNVLMKLCTDIHVNGERIKQNLLQQNYGSLFWKTVSMSCFFFYKAHKVLFLRTAWWNACKWASCNGIGI